MKKSLLLSLSSLIVASFALAAPEPAKPSAAGEGRDAGKPRAGEARHEDRAGREGRPEAGGAMVLGRLLEMDDAKLARLSTLLEKVRQLPASERADLHKRMRSMKDATPAEREAFAKELRTKFGAPPEGDRKGPPHDGKPGERSGKPGEGRGGVHGGARDLLQKHFATLPPDQAKAEKEKFIAMSREDKMAYLKKVRVSQGLPAQPEGAGDAAAKDTPRRPRADPFEAPEPNPSPDGPVPQE